MSLLDCCYPSYTGDPDIKGIIYWPTQVINQQSVVKCPATVEQQNATRYCVSHDFEREPTWQSPDTTKCMYIREATQTLDQLTKVSFMQILPTNTNSIDCISIFACWARTTGELGAMATPLFC